MSKFTELQAAYLRATSFRASYWEGVIKTVQSFQDDLKSYLGVTGDQKVEVQGLSPQPVVSIGWFNQVGSFEPWAITSLPKSGDDLQFALRLVFGNDFNGETPAKEVFTLSIRGEPEPALWTVTVKTDDDVRRIRVPGFLELNEYLVNSVIQKLKPKTLEAP